MADNTEQENLPQTTSGGVAQSATSSGFNNDMVAGLGGLTVFRQVALMLGLAASVAVGVGIALWSKEGNYRPLYGSLESLDSSQVLNVLDSSQIGYKIDGYILRDSFIV